MVKRMNKTVLLACCDFLILATLALTSFKKTPDKQTVSELEPDNSFQVIENEDTEEDLSFAIYLEQLNSANEKLSELDKDLQNTKEELNREKLKSLQKDSEISSLKLKLNGHNTSVHKTVLNNLWQINVSMKEDDSFSPDLFKTNFFTCSFEIGDQTYIAADFEKLGFLWPELIHDGNISKLNLTLAKTGPNPWSSVSKGPILSMTQDPSICLLKVPKSRTTKPIKILPHKKLPNYLDKMYAAKSDGRVIKIKNVSIMPTAPNWISVDEERFLGHPDKVEKGDIIITSDGLLAGLITKEVISGNKRRFLSHSFSMLDLKESEQIPLNKKNSEKYFSSFVSQTRHISKSILSEAR